MKPSAFPVTYWCPPELSAMNGAFLDRLLWAGINLVLTPVTAEAEEERVLALLDGCAARGMQAIVMDCRVMQFQKCASLRDGVYLLDEDAYRAAVRPVAARYGAHPAVRAFYVGDEPHRDVYSAICAASRIVREESGKEGYVNLLPFYPKFLAATGAPDYEQYLEGFVRDSGSRILSQDFYAQCMENGSIHEDYWYVMRSQLDAARATGAEIWHITLATKHFDRKVMTLDDFRFEISMSLAYGAQVLSYFTLLTPGNNGPYESNFMEGPLDCFGEETPVFAAMAKANRELHVRFGNIFPRLEVKRVTHYPYVPYTYDKPLPHGGLDPFTPDDVVYSLSLVRGDEPHIVVSELKDRETGEDYVFIANANRAASVAVRATFANVREVRRYDQWGVEFVTVAAPDGSAQNLKGAFWLAPGQGELHRLVK